MKRFFQHLFQHTLQYSLQHTLAAFLLFVIAQLACLPVSAHSFSNSFLNLTVSDQQVEGTLRLRIQDILWLADLDQDRNQQLSWDELQEGQGLLQQAIKQHLQILNTEQQCPLRLATLALEQLNTGLYVVQPLQAQCADTLQHLQLRYDLVMATDAAHRGILNLQHKDQVLTYVFAPNDTDHTFDLDSAGSTLSLFAMLQEGIWHIWTGYDHLLFLLALLLPLFLKRTPRKGFGLPAMRHVIKSVLWTVSAFTVAHSITLLLSTLLAVQLSSAVVETLIAISVALSGLNVIYPIFSSNHAIIAFCFGLLHGLGFAGALRDLALPTSAFVQSLLSFNVGVEVGQLSLVALVFPLLLYLRNKRYYQHLLQPLLALCIVGIGIAWAVERSAAL